MQRRNVNQAEDGEAGQQCRAEREDAEAAQVDHEAEDAGEPPALTVAEPGGVDLHHAGRAEGLQIAVHAADGDEQAKHPRERRGAKQHVHHDRARRADQHGAFASRSGR